MKKLGKLLPTAVILLSSVFVLAGCGGSHSTSKADSSRSASIKKSKSEASKKSKSEASKKSKQVASSKSAAVSSSKAVASSKAASSSRAVASSKAASSSRAAAVASSKAAVASSKAAIKPLTSAYRSFVYLILNTAEASGRPIGWNPDQELEFNLYDGGPQSDGTYIIACGGGAKGMQVFTVASLGHDRYKITCQYGSILNNDKWRTWPKQYRYETIRFN